MVTTQMVGVRGILTVNSGQMPYEIHRLEGEVKPIWAGVVFGG